MERAATTVQNQYRALVARRRCDELRKKRATKAATLIQTSARSRQARRKFDSLRAAAIRLQSWARGVRAWKDINRSTSRCVTCGCRAFVATGHVHHDGARCWGDSTAVTERKQSVVVVRTVTATPRATRKRIHAFAASVFSDIDADDTGMVVKKEVRDYFKSHPEAKARIAAPTFGWKSFFAGMTDGRFDLYDFTSAITEFYVDDLAAVAEETKVVESSAKETTTSSYFYCGNCCRRHAAALRVQCWFRRYLARGRMRQVLNDTVQRYWTKAVLAEQPLFIQPEPSRQELQESAPHGVFTAGEDDSAQEAVYVLREARVTRLAKEQIACYAEMRRIEAARRAERAATMIQTVYRTHIARTRYVDSTSLCVKCGCRDFRVEGHVHHEEAKVLGGQRFAASMFNDIDAGNTGMVTKMQVREYFKLHPEAKARIAAPNFEWKSFFSGMTDGRFDLFNFVSAVTEFYVDEPAAVYFYCRRCWATSMEAERRSAAALRVQCWFRGYVARSRMRQVLADTVQRYWSKAVLAEQPLFIKPEPSRQELQESAPHGVFSAGEDDSAQEEIIARRDARVAHLEKEQIACYAEMRRIREARRADSAATMIQTVYRTRVTRNWFTDSTSLCVKCGCRVSLANGHVHHDGAQYLGKSTVTEINKQKATSTGIHAFAASVFSAIDVGNGGLVEKQVISYFNAHQCRRVVAKKEVREYFDSHPEAKARIAAPNFEWKLFFAVMEDDEEDDELSLFDLYDFTSAVTAFYIDKPYFYCSRCWATSIAGERMNVAAIRVQVWFRRYVRLARGRMQQPVVQRELGAAEQVLADTDAAPPPVYGGVRDSINVYEASKTETTGSVDGSSRISSKHGTCATVMLGGEEWKEGVSTATTTRTTLTSSELATVREAPLSESKVAPIGSEEVFCHSDASKGGRLKKYCSRTFLGKKWQDRLIEVTDLEIHYWGGAQKKSGEQPKKQIPIYAIRRVGAAGADFKRKTKPPTNFVLTIEYESGEFGKNAETLHLCAASESELSNWLDYIHGKVQAGNREYREQAEMASTESKVAPVQLGTFHEGKVAPVQNDMLTTTAQTTTTTTTTTTTAAKKAAELSAEMVLVPQGVTADITLSCNSCDDADYVVIRATAVAAGTGTCETQGDNVLSYTAPDDFLGEVVLEYVWVNWATGEESRGRMTVRVVPWASMMGGEIEA